jgi:predicted anti-sigma-YlaC factor YlaD
MRCSSCEPLLDAYLESALRPRQTLEVTEHLRGCPECEGLMRELRVIDALLTTARPPGSVSSNFTAAVVSATRATHPHTRRRTQIWLPLLVYLIAAWALAALVALQSQGFTRLFGMLFESEQRAAAAFAAALRALAPATPLAAAAVTGVLLVDLLLLAAIFYGYRRLVPLIALYIARGPRS